jgi:hypothetical protein
VGWTWTWSGFFVDDQIGAMGARDGYPKDRVVQRVEEGGEVVFYNSGEEKLYRIDRASFQGRSTRSAALRTCRVTSRRT